MQGTCIRTLPQLIGLGAAAVVAGTAAGGGFIEEPLSLPTIGPLAAGESQTVNINVAQNNNSTVGFRFVGTVAGVSGSDMWASDLRLEIVAPGGFSHVVGGFDNAGAMWDFDGVGSTEDGTYTHEDASVFPGIAKGGEWTFTFTNDWGSAPGTHTWSDVTITLLKTEGAPEGACCFAQDGSCEILSPVDCENAGGLYQGNFTLCEDVVCPTPVICPADNNCPQDFNGDTVVNVLDLLALLSEWGACPGCQTDLNGDNVVNVLDMLSVLGAWGDCPAGGGSVFNEPEACGDADNEGCNGPDEQTTPIACGQTVCGTAWADGGTRDTDWYEITITEDTEITWSVHAEFPAQALIVNDQCADEDLIIFADAASGAGIPFEVSACLLPGTYRLFVSDQGFDGNPCGSGSNDYVASVTCNPCTATGGCCFGDGSCQDLTPGECNAAGGEFNVLPCAVTVCLPDPLDCPQGETDEGEICVTGEDDTTNGGCNVSPPVFGQICCGDAVTGTVWADGGTRDLDWFVLYVDEQSLVTVELVHNFGLQALEGVAFIASGDCPAAILTSAAGPSPVSVSSTLQPGVYFVIVAPSDFEGLPCNTGVANEYSVSVTCTPFNLCEGICGDVFFDPDTGFFCSCEDFCIDFGNCCPGICQTCPKTLNCVENDLCPNAIDVTANINGAPVAGSNLNATPPFGGGADPETPGGSPSCQWNGNPDAVHNTVWYSFTAPASGQVFVSLCGLNGPPFNDSIIAVYGGSCGALTEIACGEDECPEAGFFSQTCASGLTPGQTYYILVANPGDWADSTPGDFQFEITDACVECPAVVCEDNMGEPCNLSPDTANGGCNVTPNVFQAATCGQTFCGELRADGGTRDLDWFQFTLDAPATVTWSAEADFNADNPPSLNVWITTAACPPTVIEFLGAQCASEVTATNLAAGNYYLIVAPSTFEGLPCSTGPHRYTATLTCE